MKDDAGNPGLRERQRRLGQDAILDAAVALFNAKGYQKTTIQMIADHAGLGVATVFRHFRSKPGIVAELMRRDADEVFVRGQQVLKEPGDDPVRAMLDFLLIMLDVWEVPINRVRGFSLLWLALPTGHADTDALVRWADTRLLGLIRQLLAHFRERGKIPAHHDLADMAYLIFAVFNQHYIGLATGDEPTIRLVREELSRRIPLMFEPWLSGTPSGTKIRRAAPAARAKRKRAIPRRRG